MINVKRHELKRSYSKKYNLYKEIKRLGIGYGKSRCLLLFYAVECGLKNILLNNISKNTTDDLFNFRDYSRLKTHGHDIRMMLKLLQKESAFPLRRITASDNRYIEPEEYNQMWRYGVDINLADEQYTEESLNKIAQWIETQI